MQVTKKTGDSTLGLKIPSNSFVLKIHIWALFNLLTFTYKIFIWENLSRKATTILLRSFCGCDFWWLIGVPFIAGASFMGVVLLFSFLLVYPILKSLR